MDRKSYENRILKAFRIHPIVAILGPRQCGKTTLSRMFSSLQQETCHVFDLENPKDLSRLQNPLMALEEKQGLIIIDEIQRLPELFPVLRVLADEPSSNRRFLILGSASRDLIKQSSESLAGRIQYLELTPFNLSETQDLKRLWIRGGFPKSYLADNLEDSLEWRRSYITTFLEQDIPALGIKIPPQALRRFWTMISHYHGGILNLSELGNSFGVSHTTIRNYLDILCGTFMLRELQPWWENMAKRQVKTPKIYLRDSGLFHLLQGIESWDDLETNPKLGASWEGIALEEVIRHHQAEPGECYFWRTHTGAELDLLLVKNGKRIGFEFKYSDAPKLTKSMLIASEELHLDELWIITPKAENTPISPVIRMVGLQNYLTIYKK